MIAPRLIEVESSCDGAKEGTDDFGRVGVLITELGDESRLKVEDSTTMTGSVGDAEDFERVTEDLETGFGCGDFPPPDGPGASAGASFDSGFAGASCASTGTGSFGGVLGLKWTPVSTAIAGAAPTAFVAAAGHFPG